MGDVQLQRPWPSAATFAPVATGTMLATEETLMMRAGSMLVESFARTSVSLWTDCHGTGFLAETRSALTRRSLMSGVILSKYMDREERKDML